MCYGWESNKRPFGSQAGTQSTQPHQPGLILILLNVLRLILWPRIWSILVYVPWVLEKNVYSAVTGQSVLEILIRSCWLIVLEFFCILAHFLPIVERGMLKSSTLIMDLSISLFCFINFSSCILQLCCLVKSHLGLLFLLGGWIFLSLYNVPASLW